MSSMKLSCAIPLDQKAGQVSVEISVGTVESLANEDREFLLGILDTLARWTGNPLLPVAATAGVRELAEPAKPKGHVPEVLNGLLRSP